jgi:transposase
MATTDYWAEAPRRRDQLVLFAPTLDAMIGEDDPVRLFDEIMAGLDWSLWEAQYDGGRGQPPLHPRHVAAGILYGLCCGIRSSRKLEEACWRRLDFLWLLEGRPIDHTTFAKFRTKFGTQLKDLFRQIGRLAMTVGLIRLGEVAFDGTRVRAYNSRYATRTAKTLEEKLAVLDELYEHMLAEWTAHDAGQKTQGTLEGQEPSEPSPVRLPEELADLETRRRKVREALAQAQAADEARRKDGINPQKNPAQVPVNDPDSRVMPNKEGGYAPNYTPTATTDGRCGMIVDCEVIAEVNEGREALASVDRIEATFGARPEKFLTDAGNNSGQIMQGMEDRGVEFYAPVKSNQPQDGQPAHREDPTQPVAAEDVPKLPRNPQGQFDKSCFVYDAQLDRYYCPQGKTLTFEKTKPDERGGQPVTLRVYRCPDCGGCPLVAACLASNNKSGRTITRDEFEEERERTAARMATPEARKLYDQRPKIAETTFAILKSVLGFRQFLLRGLTKVKIEWRWACTAFNLRKLVRQLARMRAALANLAATAEG